MKNLNKIASALALFIGVMSVFAGSKVLLGVDTKDYAVLNWLVVYNVLFGVISIIAAYLIWKNNLFAKKVVVFILAAHTCMALYLYFFNEFVALESIKAMSFRVALWLIISLLIIKSKK
ncbi:MAG: hypothetical protein GQ540_01130 [Lutibacter sp.]|uniref:hypothetical protein n=1 Tax=Lutibacter sp. TaxID=1925666 RepID=UPI0019FE2E62|nr:hypothetical protein [Lutibacter sp.]NOR27112.1 hypothetical protein [Lutibacter sp.]